MSIRSPLTGTTNVRLEKTVSCREIIKAYQNKLNIDTERFFSGLTEVQIYKCISTGYRFYYPFYTIGDSKFYEQLQQYNWYYMKWKWEHEVTKKLVLPDYKVLEIGCGNSAFVEKLQENSISCTGLELNEKAVLEARYKGLDVRTETIQQHAASHLAVYDLVCSFQVAEHIPAIGNFIEDSLKTLKKGGKLVMSVPNMDSVYQYNMFTPLNTPPHHVGLWNEKSLKKIQNFFNIRLEKIYCEPLQDYHIEFYKNALFERYKIKGWGSLGTLFNKITKTYIMNTLKDRNTIKGLTVVAQYIKL